MGFMDLTMPRTQRNPIPQSPAQRKVRVSLLPQSPALSKKDLTVSFKPMPQSPDSEHSCRFQLCSALRYIVGTSKFPPLFALNTDLFPKRGEFPRVIRIGHSVFDTDGKRD